MIPLCLGAKVCIATRRWHTEAVRVLATGAAGFVGNAVTAALVRPGHEPAAFALRGGCPAAPWLPSVAPTRRATLS